jgi:SagB-type dehydrogenase family enzyme
MSSGKLAAVTPPVKLFTHAGVRLHPPIGLDGRWRVVNLLTREQSVSSRLGAAVLISFMGGAAREDVAARLCSRYAEVREDVEAAIDALINLGLVVTADLETHRRAEDLCRSWARYGWVDAADYQLATWDYPFLDYADGGRRDDRSRMVDYVKAAPDLNRYKYFADAHPRVSAPRADIALGELTTAFSTMWTSNPELQILNVDRILVLLSAVFGQLGARPLSNRTDLMADAILKTSPSGGARHPTEGYLFAASVEGLDRGTYHFNVRDSTLDKIGDFALSPDEVFQLFSGPLRAKFNVDAFIVMSSVFERNMYRYREPRTFRTVLMDVGHLLGTTDVVAKALGINCLVQHGIDDRRICQELGLNPLQEGVIWAVALGGAPSGGPQPGEK